MDKTYVITATVSETSTLASAFTKVKAYVKPQKLVAVLIGGVSRTVRAGETFMLDASSSYDEDTETNDHLSFVWSCTQLEPTPLSDCPSFAFSPTSSTLTSTASESSECNVTTFVVRVFDSRSD